MRRGLGLGLGFQSNQLPVFESEFVGRHHEIETILMALGNYSLINIVGPGGIGKTRLAAQIAQERAAHFQRGVLFVSLTGTGTREALVATLLSALHLHVSASTTSSTDNLAALVEQAAQFLAEQDILLIFDNAEHVLEQADVFQRLSQVNGPKLLITSRQRLGLPNEFALDLRGLPRLSAPYQEGNELLPAEQLFIKSIRQINPSFQPSADDVASIQQICQLTEGMPLAIELASSWTRLLPIKFIAGQIAQNLDWLTSSLAVSRNAQHSIRAVLDYLWQLLSQEEQQQLCQLSVFQGGFERDMAESLAGTSFFFLSALVQHAFLSRNSSGRYLLHELLRQYAGERLAKSTYEFQTRLRHAQLMRDLSQRAKAEFAGPHHTTWLERMQIEMDNVREAIAWGLSQQQTQLVFELLIDLEAVWDSIANVSEVCTWFESALQNSFDPDEAAKRLRMQATLLHGRYLERLARFDLSLAQAQAALDLAHSLEDVEGMVFANRIISLVRFRKGQFDLAQSHAETAVQIAQASAKPLLTAKALRSKSLALSASQKLAEALACERQSLKIAREIDSKPDIADCLNSIAIYIARVPQYNQAIDHLQESLAINRALNRVDYVCMNLMNLGWLYHLKQEHALAEAHYQQALDILEDTGSVESWVLTQFNIGDSMMARNAAPAACAQRYRDGLTTALRIHAAPMVIYALIDTAKLCIRTQQLQLATDFLQLVMMHPAANSTARNDADALLRQLPTFKSTNTHDALQGHESERDKDGEAMLQSAATQALRVLDRLIDSDGDGKGHRDGNQAEK